MDGIGAAGANEIGGLYKDKIIDPIMHKGLHAAVGALEGAMLNGVDGAKAGASAAVIAESLGDFVEPYVEEVAQQTALHARSEEDYDRVMGDYLLQQKNLLLLTTSGIMAGLRQDVDAALVVADNAIENNAAQLLKAVVEGVKIAAKAAGNFGKGAWKKGPVVRGEILEKKLGQNLHKNFPVVDKFKDGIVTSIKSVDLKAPTYQNTTKLSHTLRKYVDKVANFKKGKVLKQEIKLHEIKGRALDIAIPKGASAAQKQVMKEAVEYGLTKNVTVTIIKIK